MRSCIVVSSNIEVKSWAMELKDELYSIGLAFVWRRQNECNLGDMTRILKETCNDIERQNFLTKFLEKSSLKMYRVLSFLWGKNLYLE
jgi:hypothetical protein